MCLVSPRREEVSYGSRQSGKRKKFDDERPWFEAARAHANPPKSNGIRWSGDGWFDGVALKRLRNDVKRTLILWGSRKRFSAVEVLKKTDNLMEVKNERSIRDCYHKLNKSQVFKRYQAKYNIVPFECMGANRNMSHRNWNVCPWRNKVLVISLWAPFRRKG